MNANEIADAIIAGTATEQQQGIALRALQTALSSQLISGLSDALHSVARFTPMIEHAYTKLNERYEADIETMDTVHLMGLIDSVQTKQIQILDLFRKVAQGKSLFPEETISEEERKVLRLVNSFKTDDEKQAFLHIVDDMLNKSQENDFDDVSKESSDSGLENETHEVPLPEESLDSADAAASEDGEFDEFK